MAEREVDKPGEPATILFPELGSDHGRKQLEKALKAADVEMKGDFRKATFEEILKNRGAVSTAFLFCGFDVEMDEKEKRVIVRVEEDDPEPPLTEYHDQAKGLDEDDDGNEKDETPEGLDEAGEQNDAPQAEAKLEPKPELVHEDEKDEDPRARVAREWDEAYGGRAPVKRKSGSRKRKPRSPKR